MTTTIPTQDLHRQNQNTDVTHPTHTVLCLGPVGGTLGGAVSLFQVTLEGLAALPNLEIEVIDTAPPPNYYGYKTHLINNETLNRAYRIIAEFRSKIGRADAVLFYANRELALAVGPVLTSIARMHRKPIYLKTIAGNLALGLAEANAPLRRYALSVMNSFTGIFAETQLLQHELQELGYRKVYYVPNCRPEASLPPADLAPQAGQARLVFISQINRLKGVFLILEALRSLHEQGYTGITCDFYGPIFGDIEAEFRSALERTPGARYLGALDVEEVLPTMRTYEGLVLPTYHSSEGHPGIIIEAMQVGIPVISSELRAIPELLTNGENGLLIEPQNVPALAVAMAFWADNPAEVIRMGAANYERRLDFSAEQVTDDIATLMLSSSAK